MQPLPRRKGGTVLHAAAKEGAMHVIKAAHGVLSAVQWANLVDKVDREGRTALFVAAELGQAEAVRWLWSHNADVWLRAAMRPQLELLAGQAELSGNEVVAGADQFLVGLPVALSKGLWVYEVEVLARPDRTAREAHELRDGLRAREFDSLTLIEAKDRGESVLQFSFPYQEVAIGWSSAVRKKHMAWSDHVGRNDKSIGLGLDGHVRADAKLACAAAILT